MFALFLSLNNPPPFPILILSLHKTLPFYTSRQMPSLFLGVVVLCWPSRMKASHVSFATHALVYLTTGFLLLLLPPSPLSCVHIIQSYNHLIHIFLLSILPLFQII
ncbi:hypothetical protein AAZX31_14G153100 [Glycine max]